MIDFIVANVYLRLIRDGMINVISTKFAEAIIKCVSREKHILDFMNFKSDWASISGDWMRWIYRSRRGQKQQAQQIENSKNHVEEEPKNEQQQQFIQTELPIPLNGYDSSGRSFHYESIGVGLIAWFLTFTSIWWLSKKERDN